ncbi:MAG: CCA tRNA nucleotidyltransferase [Pseudomonadota bacterium]|nr:CCA tRNA nucleotidyltransferase [Pseudomonadota bacterium]
MAISKETMINKEIPHFLKDPRCKELIKILNSKDDDSRYVGGCVRDYFTGHETTDIDIATKIPPNEVIKLLTKNGYKPFTTGIDHGTVSINLEELKIEITTLRKDTNHDGRHADIELIDDWEIDAARRDFTINSLYMSDKGDLFDPFDGLNDLKNRKIRFIGDPESRINEDYLRMLRLFRFISIYESIIDPAIIKILGNNKNKISKLSSERIHQEFFKIIQNDNSGKTIELMKNIDFLDTIFGYEVDISSYQRILKIDDENFFEPDLLIRFFLLVPKKYDSLSLLTNFSFSNREKKIFEETYNSNHKVKSYLSIKEVRAEIYKIGKDNFNNLVRINWARDNKISNSVQWRALLAISESFELPVFPIKAKDLLALGVPEGPLLGEILDDVESWWVDTDFTADKFSLFERMKSIISSKI